MPITIRTARNQIEPLNPSTWQGWIASQVSYDLNDIAGQFEVELTNVGRCQQFPAGTFPLPPQTPVEIYADDALILTGYTFTDNIREKLTENVCVVSGRSRGADLVDCHHYRPTVDGWQWEGLTALQIAQDVVAPFDDISISSDMSFDPIAEYQATMGETAFEILDALARREGAILRATNDGNIVMERTSSERVGFTIHCPLELETAHDTSLRFSEYHALGQRHGYNEADPENAARVTAFLTDNSVSRYRPRIVQPEGSVTDDEALTRLQWQRARDRGNGLQMQVTVPGFLDPNGEVWRVNTRVWVERPAHAINREVLISAVAFTSDENGDIAALTLRPVEAYEPEPRRRPRLSKKVTATPTNAYWDL